jgi:primary-amine oxidase
MKADRSLDQVPLVVWYTLGVLHVTRVEDFPIMPVGACLFDACIPFPYLTLRYLIHSLVKASFELRPEGFFNMNPALDVPPPPCERLKANL